MTQNELNKKQFKKDMTMVTCDMYDKTIKCIEKKKMRSGCMNCQNQHSYTINFILLYRRTGRTQYCHACHITSSNKYVALGNISLSVCIDPKMNHIVVYTVHYPCVLCV